MHRFFLPGSTLQAGHSVDLSALAYQLYTVLRLTPGARVVLLDDTGCEFITEITAISPHRVVGVALSQRPAQGEPAVHLTLYQCSLKADKFEWVLQKGTELGVSSFTPVISDRSIVRPAAALLKKYERWRAILREAAEQSGRGRIPSLSPPATWNDVVERATGVRIVAWEAQSVHAQSPEFPPANGGAHISLAIGPEGGLTGDEIALARAAGWQIISLGKRTLRAETAALAATTAIMLRWGELGDLMVVERTITT